MMMLFNYTLTQRTQPPHPQNIFPTFQEPTLEERAMCESAWWCALGEGRGSRWTSDVLMNQYALGGEGGVR